MLQIFKSLLITSLVSTLVGLVYIDKFFILFSLAFVLQVLFFYFFNSVYQNKLFAKAQELKLEEFKQLTKNIVRIQCPCAQKMQQEVELDYNKDIVYECAKCNNKIKASTDVSTVLVTEPIYFNDKS